MTHEIERIALDSYQPQYTPYRSYTGDKLLDDIIDCSQHGEPVRLNMALLAHMIRGRIISVKQNSINNPNQSINGYLWTPPTKSTASMLPGRTSSVPPRTPSAPTVALPF